jgi:hypothetical protein
MNNLLFDYLINDTSIDVYAMSVRQVFAKMYQFETIPSFQHREDRGQGDPPW